MGRNRIYTDEERKQRMLEARKKYRETHKEEIKLAKKKWRETHREHIKNTVKNIMKNIEKKLIKNKMNSIIIILNVINI